MSNKMKDIAKDQMDASTDSVVEALSTLSEQIKASRELGKDEGKKIVAKFGGEGKIADLVGDIAGYMGQLATTGATVATTPMIVMAGAAKGVYTKITDSKDSE